MDIFLQMEAKPVKMRLHFFNSAVIANSKLDYSPFLVQLFEVGVLWSTRPVVTLVSISVSMMNRADPTMYEGQA